MKVWVSYLQREKKTVDNKNFSDNGINWVWREKVQKLEVVECGINRMG